MPDFDRAALLQLLQLQAEDTAIVRLEHRRSTLPEAARLTELRGQLGELSSDLDIARKQADELAREQAKIEGEIGLLDAKIEREEKRLFSGSVSSPKELSALKAEVDMLRKKKGTLEDGELEVMVARDEANATLASLSSEHDEVTAAAAELEETVARLSAGIDEELAAHRARRGEIAPTLPADLVALYDTIRAAKGGVGAAALQGDTCTGCHTSLPAMEARRARSEPGLHRCDNCRRILVAV